MPVYVACALSSFVPPTATAVSLVADIQNSEMIIAPNANYGSNLSLTNPPPIGLNYTNSSISTISMQLELGAYIYAASSNPGYSGAIFLLGYTE